MGLYQIPCQICKKPFLWFSGNAHQICSKCKPEENIKPKAIISDLQSNAHTQDGEDIQK